MIEVRNLTKRYGDLAAIQDVTFDVAQGKVVGLLGPNGAGKTTAMKILTCFMPPTSGRATVCGYDIFDDPMQVKRSIGYLPEHPPVYPDLTVEGQLTFAAQLKEVPARDRTRQVAEAMHKTGIAAQAKRLVGNLSKGYQQRVGIAQALVHDPPVLILDEPTVGLDPTQILEIRKLVQDLGQAHTVILSTHILPEVSLTCDEVVIIHHGRIAAQGTLDSVARTVLGDDHVTVRIEGAEAEVDAALAGIEGVLQVVPTELPGDGPAGRKVYVERGRDVRRDVFQLCVARGFALLELSPPGTSLEEVFLRITSGAFQAGGPPAAAAGAAPEAQATPEGRTEDPPPVATPDAGADTTEGDAP